MILLILARLADIYTTLLNTNKWGIDVEGNPLVRKLMSQGLFIPYQLFVLGIAIIIAERTKYRSFIYIGLSILSFLASISNLYCYYI